MMEYEEFGRSGTAPTKSTKSNAPSQRPRPKTRGVVTGAGASELADLNMSLKMDKGNSNGTGYYEYSEDPIEDFQSAVENWERARRARQGADRETTAVSNSSKTNSAYTRGDPVSAAYSSQFRSTVKVSSPKGSPRTSTSKARAVAELNAAYGINDQSNQISQQPRRRSSSGTSRRNRTADTSNRTSAENTSTMASSSSSPRPSSRGASRAFTAGVSKKETMASSDRPTTAEVRSAQSRVSARSAAGVAGGGAWGAATDRSNPPQPSAKSSSIGSSESGVSGGGGPPRRPVAPSAPSPQPPQSPSTYTSTDASTKTSFRRRQEQQYRVSSSGPVGGRRVDDGSNESPNHTTSSTPTCLTSSTAAVAGGGPAKKESDILDMVSPCIDDYDDDDGSELAETERFTNAVYVDCESQRPQSRKLYMGSAGAPSNSTTRMSDLKEGATSDGSVLRAPRSAGALSRHRMSPEVAGGLEKKGLGDGSDVEGMKMEKTSSFNGSFKQPSSHWKDTSVNYDERPPSRQRSAFPTHLADVDSGINHTRVLREKKHAFSDINTSTDTAPPAETVQVALSGSPRSSRHANSSTEMLMEGPNDRPPSRQKIRAQNLFDKDSDYETQQDIEGSGEQSGDSGFVSPLLTPTDSSLSMGGIELFDNGADVAMMAPQPRYQQSRTADPSRSPFESSSLGPMYDPTADGFTQLDRSATAPFKIRYNQSTARSSNTRTQLGVSSPSPDNLGSRKPASHRFESGIAHNKKENRGSPVANMMWHKVGIAHDSSHGDSVSTFPPRGMGTSKSTPSLNSPARQKGSSRDAYDAPTLSKSASSSDHLVYQQDDSEPFSRARHQPSLAHADIDNVDEDLTVMTMYSDDEHEGSTDLNDPHGLMLGSSLGEDFLNLFARGGR